MIKMQDHQVPLIYSDECDRHCDQTKLGLLHFWNKIFQKIFEKFLKNFISANFVANFEIKSVALLPLLVNSGKSNTRENLIFKLHLWRHKRCFPIFKKFRSVSHRVGDGPYLKSQKFFGKFFFWIRVTVWRSQHQFGIFVLF